MAQEVATFSKSELSQMCLKSLTYCGCTYWIVLSMRVVVIDDELIVMLSPGEDVAPVRLIIRDHWESVAPSFHDGSHVV